MNTMLVSSRVPLNLWETIFFAFHIQNRIPNKKTIKTPYEIWKDYVANIAYLKVQECFAKVLFPKPKKGKLGYKTFDVVFIGFVKNRATYRFLDIKLKNNLGEVNNIIETKNVDLFENISPMKPNRKEQIQRIIRDESNILKLN